MFIIIIIYVVSFLLLQFAYYYAIEIVIFSFNNLSKF